MNGWPEVLYFVEISIHTAREFKDEKITRMWFKKTMFHIYILKCMSSSGMYCISLRSKDLQPASVHISLITINFDFNSK